MKKELNNSTDPIRSSRRRRRPLAGPHRRREARVALLRPRQPLPRRGRLGHRRPSPACCTRRRRRGLARTLGRGGGGGALRRGGAVGGRRQQPISEHVLGRRGAAPAAAAGTGRTRHSRAARATSRAGHGCAQDLGGGAAAGAIRRWRRASLTGGGVGGGGGGDRAAERRHFVAGGQPLLVRRKSEGWCVAATDGSTTTILSTSLPHYGPTSWPYLTMAYLLLEDTAPLRRGSRPLPSLEC